MTLTVTKAIADEDHFVEIFELLIGLHKAGGYAPMSTDKTAEACYRVLAEGMTFVARLDGQAVGTLGITELKFWYSDAGFLQDAWFYVKPKHRRGRVGVELMRAARAEAEARNLILFVTVSNPDRRNKKTAMTLTSQTAGYIPLGYTLRMK